MLQLSNHLVIDSEVRQAKNLCDRFSDDDLAKIGQYCYQGFQSDKFSRSAWEDRTSAAMDMAMQVSQAKNFPWPGCANVVFPLISIAALQFSSRSYSNIIQGTEVVHYRVVGEDPTGEIKLRADTIGCHMSWQVLEQDRGWEEQHDRLLINLSIVGTNFIKTFNRDGYNTSLLVMASDLVLDYFAKSVEDCTRKTHIIRLYKNEVISNCRSGLFVDVEEEAWFKSRSTPPQTSSTISRDNRHGTSPPAADDEAPFEFHEQHRFLDLDDDGYAEPYIVTYEATSKKVVRIVARWERDVDVERDGDQIVSIRPWEYFTKYGFIPSPDGGIYDIGFGVLLGPLNESVNTLINQLLDAGTMSNATGGFLGRGAKFKGGVYTMAPWEWKRVDAQGDDIRKNLVPFEGHEPSMTLFRLLDLLINYIQRLSGATDIMVGETPGQNTPAETSRNALEQGMMIYSTIFKRVWRSMKEEFKKLHRLNSVYLPEKTYFGDKNYVVRREDYTSNSDFVIPVADPNVTSEAQRVQRATAIRQASLTRSGYDPDAVERYYLKALRVDSVNTLFPGSKAMPPGKSEKLALEEMRLQAKQLALQVQARRDMLMLMETQRLNTAQIAKLQAEALKLMADTEQARDSHQLQVMQTFTDTLIAHNDQITDRLRMMHEAEQADKDRQAQLAQAQSASQDQPEAASNDQ